MSRAAAVLLVLAACKSTKSEPRGATTADTKLGQAPALDAAPAAGPTADATDCGKLGAKMMSLIRAGDDADTTPGFADKLGVAVDAMFRDACAQDGWPEAAKRCVLDLPAGEGADPCFQQLGAYAMVALGTRLQELPAPDAPPVPACDDAGRALGFAWALRATRAAPPGASPQTYTEMFQALGNELEEVCTDLAWAEPARACLVNAKLPEELDAIDACVATLTADQRGKLDALHGLVEAELSKQLGAGTPTGGDDCAAVGDAMVQIWTLKAQRSMAKHAAAAQWDLDHLDDLRALVIAACVEDAWPTDVRTCLTALKLPDEASAFEACIGALPPAAMQALGTRTAVLEAERDAAIGPDP